MYTTEGYTVNATRKTHQQSTTFWKENETCREGVQVREVWAASLIVIRPFKRHRHKSTGSTEVRQHAPVVSSDPTAHIANVQCNIKHRADGWILLRPLCVVNKSTGRFCVITVLRQALRIPWITFQAFYRTKCVLRKNLQHFTERASSCFWQMQCEWMEDVSVDRDI